jgi:hypothetical protein
MSEVAARIAENDGSEPMTDRIDDSTPPTMTAEVAAPAARADGDLVDRTLEFFSTAAAQASAGAGDELVVRRVIMQKKRWEELVEIAEVLRNKGVPTNPSEVAAIVIEAGLERIRELATGRTSQSAPASATPPPATVDHASPGPSLALDAKESEELARLVRGRSSQRSVQRALGLWLGSRGAPHASGDVPTEPLRELCRRFGVYNIANFAQNMKKDAACFAEVRQGALRTGWRLTEEGWQRARALLGAPAEETLSV